MSKFNPTDDELLLKLRSNRYMTPFAEIVRLMPNHTQDSLRNRMWELRKKDEKWFKDETIGYLDIESSDFKANRGFMLSWALGVKGKTLSDHITKKEIFDEKFDHRIVASLTEACKSVDVLVTYYGTGFDLKFWRTRALEMNQAFPHYNSIKHIDLYYEVKSKLCLTRNSLDAACHLFGKDTKTHFDVGLWRLAAVGNVKAMKLVLAHNTIDVDLLKFLFDKLKPYQKFTRRSI